INKEDEYGETPLSIICKKGNTDLIQFLIRHGADINKKNRYGDTKLIKACMNGNRSEVKNILSADPKVVDEGNKDGNTPLIEACKNGNEKIVELLIEYNADINKNNFNLLLLFHQLFY
ncbi:ankyrin, partial [Piromyces finnis]